MSSAGSALAVRPRRGSTTPRLWTPPLESNCDPTREDACSCGCGLNPDTSWGFECIAFLTTVLGWTLFPWQSWLYVHALEKDETGLGYRFSTLIILIARQNGKTQWLKGLVLWKLFLDGAEEAIISAQNLDMAEETLAEAVADIRTNRVLKREFKRHITTNGKHKLTLKSANELRRAKGLAPLPNGDRPRAWKAAAMTGKAGRSRSIDIAVLDELREHHTWDVWNAIEPTTSARVRSLTVGASNAGEAKSVVLKSLREGARAKIEAGATEDSQTGLFEWSVPDDVDFEDPQFWPMANPSMGYNPAITERKLAGKLDNMRADNVAGFKTEYLCMWVSTLSPGKFPAAEWKAAADKASRRAPSAEVWTSVDVNFERSISYISVAAARADGRWHNELIAANRGSDWVLPFYLDPKRLVPDEMGSIVLDGARYRSKFAGIVIQARGCPASGLIEVLQAAGLPVVELGGPDLTKAYGDYYEALTDDRIRYRPAPALVLAGEIGLAKNIGDEWVLDRRQNDCSAAISSVQATWGAARPAEPVFRSAYESEGLTVV